MQYLVDKRGLSDCFYIDSAATSREEIGNGVHHGTRAKLREVGIPCGDHRARQMTRGDYEEYDYLIGMDTWNIRNMNRIVGADPDHKIPKAAGVYETGVEILRIPWYTGNFDETYRDVSEGCEGLLAHILKEDMVETDTLCGSASGFQNGIRTAACEGAGEAYGTAAYICEYGGTCFQRRRGSYVALRRSV